MGNLLSAGLFSVEDRRIKEKQLPEPHSTEECFISKLAGVSWARNALSYMEPEDSFPCSQEAATGRYRETVNPIYTSNPIP
jgi:hypothetical protein